VASGALGVETVVRYENDVFLAVEKF